MFYATVPFSRFGEPIFVSSIFLRFLHSSSLVSFFLHSFFCQNFNRKSAPISFFTNTDHFDAMQTFS